MASMISRNISLFLLVPLLWFGCLDAAVFVSGFGGTDFTSDKDRFAHMSDPGWTASGAIGYRLPTGTRLDVEGSYRRNNKTTATFRDMEIKMKGTTRTTAVMANIRQQLPFLGIYTGAGVGYAQSRSALSALGVKKHTKKEGTAWQTLAGFSFPIFYSFDASIEYRYFNVKNGIRDHTIGLMLTCNL